MKNILKLAAALFVLSTAANASATPLPVQPAPTPQTINITLEKVFISSVVHTTARFTPPQFCYIGKVKVACTFTDAPSKDPTRP